MMILNQKELGKGFIQLKAGDSLKSLDQYFSFEAEKWKLGSSFTSEGQSYNGVVPHRRPVTFFNKVLLFPAYLRKVYTYKVISLFKKIFKK